MAPHDSVEIRVVCKADYFDPQLKIKLHEIRDNLRQILHTGRRRFALKKIQPWNSIKVTFDIPKEAADRLRLLAVQGNARLIELGILSVEVVGESNTIVLNNAQNSSTIPTNSKDVSASSSLHATAVQKSSSNVKLDDNCAKRMKIENDLHMQNNNLLLTNTNHINPTNQYQVQQINHRHGQVLYSNYPKTSSVTTNAYVHDSWAGYKVKVNGTHYYPSQQTSYDTRQYETNLSAQCSNETSSTNTFQ
ncbi:hypothetical protein I4U23_002711 [Adineta vaga]|nr:hypothetical protein I4U23_002711 [Adineta vaga]